MERLRPYADNAIIGRWFWFSPHSPAFRHEAIRGNRVEHAPFTDREKIREEIKFFGLNRV
jgi:hypothetical protein